MTEEIEKKLAAYFGFASRKRATVVGLKLEELLVKNKVALVIVLPECSTKNEEKLIRLIRDEKNCKHIRYTGSFDVKGQLGYEKLKAVGIMDSSLAAAIYETMKLEIEKEDNYEQIQA